MAILSTYPNRILTKIAGVDSGGNVGLSYGVGDSTWSDVKAYGALGDFTTNDTTPIQNAINASGGIVYFPEGSYYVPSGLVVNSKVRLIGAGRGLTYLFCGDNDVITVDLAEEIAGVHSMTVGGKGFQIGGSFGATQPTIRVKNVHNDLYNLQVYGGFYGIQTTAASADVNLIDVITSGQFGPAVNGNGSTWHIRCKYDHGSGAGVSPANTPPYAARANLTAVTIGQVRTLSNYLIICTIAGTTGGSTPTLKNYGDPITDGSVTWLLYAPDPTGSGLGFFNQLIQTSGEHHYTQCDFSSDGQFATHYISMSTGTRYVDVADSVLSSLVYIDGAGAAVGVNVHDCETFGLLVADNHDGYIQWNNNIEHDSNTFISIGANVSDFSIRGNYMALGTIETVAGTGDRYIIKDNTGTNAGATITDSAAGGAAVIANNT